MRWSVRSLGMILVFALIGGACSDDDAGTTATTIGPETPTTASSTETTGSTGTIGTTTTAPPCQAPPGDTQLEEVRVYVAGEVMANYQILRHDESYLVVFCYFDWTTDDCSGPQGNEGPGYDFLHPCHRHDFGYRNYKRLEVRVPDLGDVWNEEIKLLIDDVFLGDMREDCSARWLLEKPVCLGMAQSFYWVVRAFGADGCPKLLPDAEGFEALKAWCESAAA